MTTPHILIVEDDKDIGLLVAKYLKANEMRVSVAENGRAMDRILQDTRISLIVLDRMLPGEDGLSICRRLRASSDIPIIILTAQADEVERIVGLEMGADDYLGKPFNPRELAARLRAIHRRVSEGSKPPREVLEVGDVVLDVGARSVKRNGQEVALTTAEFALLELFLRSAGRVVSRESIAENVLGRRLSPFDRSVDVHVSNLRKKLDPSGTADRIKTVRGTGYIYAT